MTKINPDNLIKVEPYLLITKIDVLYLGFFDRHEHNWLYFENDILVNTDFKEKKEFHVGRIKSLTHLKRGEVIK